MAKVVRKVSNKKLAKKGNKVGKIIALVASSIVLVVGAALGIYFGFFHEKDDNSSLNGKDYFVTLETTNGDEVEFLKGSYRGIENYIDETNAYFKEYVIVFSYNPDTFYPYGDEDNDIDINEQHKALLTKLADLQHEVNEAKKRNVKIDFFIVDLTVGSNSEIGSDSSFGAFYPDSEVENMGPMFVFIEAGEYKSSVEISSKNLPVSTSDVSEMNNTTIKNTINYVKTLVD